MAISARTSGPDGLAAGFAALLRADGSEGHPHRARLVTPGADPRDAADAAHLLSMLHGRFPGVIDLAIERPPVAAALDRLFDCAAGFAVERAMLARLVVEVGPIPSTPGQAQTEAAVASQRHALGVLGRSERVGTAFGAAIALAGDWRAIRALLDRIGAGRDLTAPPLDLPSSERLVADLDLAPAVERAILFGAQQMLAQHRGLWDLLEARASARAG